MTSSTFLKVETSVLWEAVAKQDHLWVVMLNDGLPFIEDPETIERESYLADDEKESLLLTFVDRSDADEYAEALPEMHDDLRPSALSVKPIAKNQLFGMIEELMAVSMNDYDCPIRIDVARTILKGRMMSDVLYSPYLPLN